MIDYRAVRFEDIVHGIDVVFDTVGGETLDRSWGVLKPGGRLVTIAASVDGSPHRTRRRFSFSSRVAGVVCVGKQVWMTFLNANTSPSNRGRRSANESEGV